MKSGKICASIKYYLGNQIQEDDVVEMHRRQHKQNCRKPSVGNPRNKETT
jgi:hypothetical protein